MERNICMAKLNISVKSVTNLLQDVTPETEKIRGGNITSFYFLSLSLLENVT